MRAKEAKRRALPYPAYPVRETHEAGKAQAPSGTGS